MNQFAAPREAATIYLRLNPGAAAAIVSQTPDRVTFDVDHPAYPRARGKVAGAIVAQAAKATEVPTTVKAAAKTEAWPLAVKMLAMGRKPGDKGAGDTLARLFNVLPAYKGMGAGDAFKAFMKSIGKPCGCSDRQAKLNAMYPYRDPP
jgi:hypothetical protein